MQGSCPTCLPTARLACASSALALTSLSVVCEKKSAPSLSATSSGMWGTICRRQCRRRCSGDRLRTSKQTADSSGRQQQQQQLRQQADGGTTWQQGRYTDPIQRLPPHLLSKESHLGG
jgi:hypothetical protein